MVLNAVTLGRAARVDFSKFSSVVTLLSNRCVAGEGDGGGSRIQ